MLNSLNDIRDVYILSLVKPDTTVFVVSGVSQENAKLRTEILALIESVRAGVTSNAVLIASLDSRVDTLENRFNARVDAIKTDIDTLQGHVSELSENDANQSARLETVEGKTESNENRISVAEENISDVQEVVDNQGVAIDTELGANIDLEFNAIDGHLRIFLYSKNGVILAARTVDLPLESVVVSGEYLPGTKTLVLTLQNGNIINIPLGDIIDGLLPSSAKGQPNGVASLDENGKVPAEQLPEGIGGGGSLPEGFNPEDYVKFTDYANYDKAGIVYSPGGDEVYNGGIYFKDGKAFIVGSARSGALSEAFFNNPTVYSVPVLTKDLYRWTKVGLVQNTETLTDEEKASACEWIGAVKKVTTTTQLNQAYVKGATGTHVMFDMSNDVVGGTIAVRTANGQVRTGTPSAGVDAVNKKYVDDNFVAKMTGEPDSGATRGFIYGLDSYGTTQKLFRVQVQANADTIPLRNSNGTFYVGTPTLQYEVVNKGYVDDNFVAKFKPKTYSTLYIQNTDGTFTQRGVTAVNYNQPGFFVNTVAAGQTTNEPNSTVVASTPIGNWDCTPKKYVDDEIAAVKDNYVTARIFIHDDADYPSYTFLINVPKAFYEFYYMVPYELAIEYLKRVGATGWETAVLCTGFFNLAGGRVYYEEGAGCIRVGTSPDQASAEEYSEASLQLIDFYTE